MKTVNQKLKELILDKGIKLTTISQKTGFSSQNIHRILESEDIKLSQLLSICGAIDVEVASLLEASYEKMLNKIAVLEEEIKALKYEKSRILNNSVGFDKLRNFEKLVENNMNRGLGLIYFEHDSLNKLFVSVSAPLKGLVSNEEYTQVEYCAINIELTEDLEKKGYQIDIIR
jgi:DNA-binding Xre family transcriptional regulator